jgi:hypothetical protein
MRVLFDQQQEDNGSSFLLYFDDALIIGAELIRQRVLPNARQHPLPYLLPVASVLRVMPRQRFLTPNAGDLAHFNGRGAAMIADLVEGWLRGGAEHAIPCWSGGRPYISCQTQMLRPSGMSRRGFHGYQRVPVPSVRVSTAVKNAGRSACCVQALQIASRRAKPLSVIQRKMVWVFGGQTV